MEYLFLCSIGPVQDFIALARRSRDLWYGSWMLSELSKSAALAAAEEYGLKNLVFPAPEELSSLEADSDLGVSNRILFITDDAPDQTAKKLRRAIDQRLSALREHAYQELDDIDVDLAQKQLDDLVEFYWSAVEYSEEKYLEAKTRVEALMKVRKNTREFSQFDGKPVMKSSLDGSRETVIPEDAYPKRWEDEESQAEKARQLYDTYRAHRSERLSGVDLLKRLGSKHLEPDFKSTSHMAAEPFLQVLKEKGGPESVNELFDDIRALFEETGWKLDQLDGALLYETRVADHVPTPSMQERIQEQLEKLINRVAGGVKPGSYYALMLADGDSMGRTIDAQKTIHRHRDLSQVLSEYSQEVKETIHTYHGVPVYSGGDDILAYLPLNTVLTCGQVLEKTFRERMQAGEFYFMDDGGVKKHPTLSTGIVVAHHLTPLSDVLRLAREAEKKAKGIPGKNGLAITIQKRSGAPRTISGKWARLKNRLQMMIDYSIEDMVSNVTAYDLDQLGREISTLDLPREAVQLEVSRILSRKRESGSAQLVSHQVEQSFQTWLEEDELPIREIARELIVAEMFARLPEVAMRTAEHDEVVKI